MMLDRRTLLFAGAATLTAGTSIAKEAPIPIIDTHIHLWDLTRPQGAPFPPKGLAESAEFKKGPASWRRVLETQRMTAQGYRREFASPGVVGIIPVEASPWVEDNLWLLEECAKDTMMVGVVGNLRPEAKEFPEYLERYHKNPLFRGIRYGNIWGYNIVEQADKPEFLGGLKLLAQAGLVLDVGNPEIGLLQATVRISDAVPDLRIMVEHLMQYSPASQSEAAAYEAVLREFRQRPQLYGKIGILPAADGTLSTRLDDHRERLDRLHEAFGADRVVGYGFSSTVPALGIMRDYYSAKTREAAEKFFWKNSLKIYNWVHRAANQPTG